MNFIAHLYLSGTNEGIMMGNFIADAVKGKEAMKLYPLEIQHGITLHRKIDFFTDNHPVFKQSKHILVPTYNHFAGILVDIFYDHFLTLNWNNYSEEQLNDFSIRCINTIEKKWEYVPDHMRMFFNYMKRYDRINGYQHLKTITSVLAGMNRRTNSISGMDKATKDLLLHFEVLQEQFRLFFPELQMYVKQELALEGL